MDNTAPPPSASLNQQVAQDVPTMSTCDFYLDRAYCQFPWPSNFFTVADAATDTKLRVNLDAATMPRNTSGFAIVPTEWNRNDGFSPGQAILTKVPGLDLVKTGAAPLTNIEASVFSTAPIAVYGLRADENTTPVPHLVWAELDANVTKQAGAPPSADPGPALIIRPTKNFQYGHRYAVVLRNLKNVAGEDIPAPAAFRIYRDNATSQNPQVTARRAGFEKLFAQLGKAGIKRSELYMTWDFTVASKRNLTERVLHMRDDALASLGPAAPAFRIDSVINNPRNGSASAITAKRIRGHITVPCYLNTQNCITCGTLNYTPGQQGQFGDGKPERIGSGTPLAATASVPVICSVARKTLNGAADPATATTFTAARPSLYGHALLGSRDEGNTYDLNVRTMAEDHNTLFCGTVFGYAETHMHLGGSEALGGRVGYGSPFSTFGVIDALENCEVDHGPGGGNDLVDFASNPDRQSNPPHETQGWPTFRDWPPRTPPTPTTRPTTAMSSSMCPNVPSNTSTPSWYAMGLRAIFAIHLFDNALGGARLAVPSALGPAPAYRRPQPAPMAAPRR